MKTSDLNQRRCLRLNLNFYNKNGNVPNKYNSNSNICSSSNNTSSLKWCSKWTLTSVVTTRTKCLRSKQWALLAEEQHKLSLLQWVGMGLHESNVPSKFFKVATSNNSMDPKCLNTITSLVLLSKTCPLFRSGSLPKVMKWEEILCNFCTGYLADNKPLEIRPKDMNHF